MSETQSDSVSADADSDIRQTASDGEGRSGAGVVWTASLVIGALVLAAVAGVVRRRRR
ncbi:hypothetical protein OS125_10775 [Corynebacterium sp. P7003]|uniref:LPXTG cell wall anchor domain-containing protein n=1 Tax=Corynebacterium pygosceleis TaxID=2800406 RepID=A0ABT3WWX1_9CORY|nr:hypothetical protein [Corynebacterium pygosceleis]MCX7445715.1 hypothetical protein [Corynebacterium pygosceleis]